MQTPMPKDENEWKKTLTPEQYDVLRCSATEAPFTGEYVDTDDKGMYLCAGCGTPLFSSETKFHSGSGWPSFFDVVDKGNVELKDDNAHGMHRTEVVCKTCGGHLGHLFDDAPQTPTGQRFCINSAALKLKKSDG